MSIFYHFLAFWSSLYILDFTTLIVVYFANIFFKILGWLLSLLSTLLERTIFIWCNPIQLFKLLLLILLELYPSHLSSNQCFWTFYCFLPLVLQFQGLQFSVQFILCWFHKIYTSSNDIMQYADTETKRTGDQFSSHKKQENDLKMAGKIKQV